MTPATLSVVLANYNHGRYIGEALEAMFGQPFVPSEVIVVDDGSTDESVEMIRSLQRTYPGIQLLENGRNRGITFSNARGLAAASGTFVYHATADDRVLPGFFAQAMDLFEAHPTAGLCCCDLASSEGLANRFHLSDRPCWFPPVALEAMALRTGYLPGAGINSIFRRQAVLEAGGIVPELRWYWDVFLAQIVAARHGMCYLPEPLVMIRAAEASYSSSGRRQWSEQTAIFRALLSLLDAPALEDIQSWIRRTGVWPMMHPAMLRILAGRREYRAYLSSVLIRRIVWHGLKDLVRTVAPRTLKHVYYAIRNRHRRIVFGSKKLPSHT